MVLRFLVTKFIKGIKLLCIKTESFFEREGLFLNSIYTFDFYIENSDDQMKVEELQNCYHKNKFIIASKITTRFYGKQINKGKYKADSNQRTHFLSALT